MYTEPTLLVSKTYPLVDKTHSFGKQNPLFIYTE